MNKFDFDQQQSESKDFHIKYDKIIRQLHKDLKTPHKVESHIVDMAYLQAKKYIYYEEIPNEKNWFMVTLAPKGCIFITEGGFEEQDRVAREKNDELEQNKKAIMHSIKYSKLAFWISVATGLVTLVALVYSMCKPERPIIVKETVIKESVK